MIDTLKLSHELAEDADFTPKQAEKLASAFAQTLTTEVATKADLTELRNATKADLTELRNATKADLTELRNATKADLTELRGDIQVQLAALETRLFLKTAGMLLVAVLIQHFLK